MYNHRDETPEDCGHHCDDDCPRCGSNRPRVKNRVRQTNRRSRRAGRQCFCEGSDHDHGCPYGM